MIRAILDSFLWGTGLWFWLIGLGGLIGPAAAGLIQAARAARKERAP
jgi:hypothetical protein